MADIKHPAGPQEDNYPPPPGPPPGHNGLNMNPSHPEQQQQQQQQFTPDSHSELYGHPSPQTTHSHPSAFAQNQHTPHQPPPPEVDGALKKAGWGRRISMLSSKAAAPFNMLANKLGAETFLPSTMEKEVEKAARILMAFCTDGIYTDVAAPATVEAPTTDADGKPTTAAVKPKKNRTLLTIPSKVIDCALGLAIFTTARAGFHVSGATGSGVLVARLPDGSWSPPTGIQVHSVGAGFMIGIDIYDCVVVINTREALDAFTKTRMSLGSDLAVVAGPWGAGGSVDFAAPQFKGKGKATNNEASEPIVQEAGKQTDAEGRSTSPPTWAQDANETMATAEKTNQQPNAATVPPAGGFGGPSSAKDQKPSAFMATIKGPTYSYVKSRGFYAGVQVDGTIVTERRDANADFYGEPVVAHQIIRGDVPLVPGRENWVNVVKPLWDTIRGAEGRHGGGWVSQMSPDSGYGDGDRPSSSSGYPTGFDPVSASPAPPKPPRPATDAATAGVAAMNLGGGSGSSSSREAGMSSSSAGGDAAEAEAARVREAHARKEAEAAADRAAAAAPTRKDSIATVAPPGYSETLRPGETSPSVADEGFDALSETVGAGAGAGAGAGSAREQAPPPAYVDDGTAKPGVGDAKS